MHRRLAAALVALALIGAACGDDDAGGNAAVTIDSPAAGTQVAAGTAMSIQVTASDDTGVGRIDLQIGGQTFASASNASAANPFTAIQGFTPTDPGTFTIVAVAYRPDGAVIGSAQIQLTVTGEAVTTTTATETTTATTTGGTTATTTGGTTATTAGGTTSTTAGTTTTTTAGDIAPDDGGDGSTGSPPEHSIQVEAKNTGPQATVFQGEISVPGDRGDGIHITVTNLFQGGTGQSNANVSVQFVCSPGGPRVRLAPAGYTAGSACDAAYVTNFSANYDSETKTYYIFVPDGVEGYFEYTLTVVATRF